ncbi:hypothetical protein AB0O42_35535 [Streptomyces sp. NPDC089922]|uniref:hypothetical protein n=1 Tax=Streptomyces sp. NPDC089922 TaxID=3155189 RepID=UPI00343418F2
MYGQTRIALLERGVAAVGRLARVGRVALRLVTATRMGPTDIYAAVATARFLAAHELIERAEASCDHPEAEITQIRLPLWFGSTTIHEEN